ncbi:hypothetical protein TcasGA2_TC000134 [Tribolium castaneum]|uniref:Ubiquitin-like protease family profile domain-containing protein n=1 Tax=Tribolium castaneum TaxID=7070 RepID=D6WDD6_TRICA|nr:hypothetical protein TcasGA2_TC000134 [Tribolium castaneum]
MFDTLNNSKDLEDIDEETETETEDTEIPHTLYQKSKFYRHFFKICEQDKKMINSAIDSDNINIFYNPLILDLILKKYLPVLPLWSNIYPNLRDRDSIERFSNAPVENWFCQVKNNILKPTGLRLRSTRFIRAVREVVLSKSKESALNIDKNQCGIIKKKRIQTKNIDLGLESEENWNKKIKSEKKKSYFEKPINEIHPSKVKEIKNVDFYNNNLIRDDRYYTLGNSGVNYVVGYYSNAHPMKELYLEDFETLGNFKNFRKMWLSNFLMDISLHVLYRKNQHKDTVRIITTHETLSIFENTCPKVTHTLEGIWLLPLLINQNHWCFVIIDFDKKTFSFINPLKISNLNQTETYLKKFLLGIRAPRRFSFTHWRCNIFKHPVQKNAYDCGVYVLLFAEKFIKEENPDLYSCYEPEEFRIILRNLLLEMSDDMENRCLICGQLNLNVTTDWVECDSCKRWIMLNCLPPRLAPSNISENFTCFACQNYQNL